MIELLLQAERSLTVGQLDAAERLYRQAIAGDPRSSIAVVGLARVALDRGDDRGAYTEAQRALAIDPDNPAAQRLVSRLAEVMRHRGEEPPTVSGPTAAFEPAGAPSAASGLAASSTPAARSRSQAPRGPTPSGERPAKRRGLFGRILGR